ncbi:hypothetical protein MRB53_009422 [Persea americana]|uniref:Uncharacterized protein n=1 Tax=Persea americana TaxID=3435 RepID=A0ACC2LP49_PERAE|nr:hypothetical protein MRB53_009422 [Persea americana]
MMMKYRKMKGNEARRGMKDIAPRRVEKGRVMKHYHLILSEAQREKGKEVLVLDDEVRTEDAAIEVNDRRCRLLRRLRWSCRLVIATMKMELQAGYEDRRCCCSARRRDGRVLLIGNLEFGRGKEWISWGESGSVVGFR